MEMTAVAAPAVGAREAAALAAEARARAVTVEEARAAVRAAAA